MYWDNIYIYDIDCASPAVSYEFRPVEISSVPFCVKLSHYAGMVMSWALDSLSLLLSSLLSSDYFASFSLFIDSRPITILTSNQDIAKPSKNFIVRSKEII